MVELAIYTAAAYRALLEAGLSRESSRSAVADIGWNVYALLLRLNSLPLRLVTRDPGKRLRGTIGLLLRFPFNAPGAPGYAVEVLREDDDLYTHFTHCPPQTLIRTVVAETGDCGDLALLWQICGRRVVDVVSAMRAELVWWLGEAVNDGLPDRGQTGLRRRPCGSFFPLWPA